MIREYIIKISDQIMEGEDFDEGGPPELIRCKDCKYYSGGIDGYCDRWFRRTGGNMSFCNEADRKDDELTER